MPVAAVPTVEFGPLLRSWRAARRFSQLELSTSAAVSARHLSYLETGRSRPSREMVVHLAEVLDVPIAERNELLRAAGFAPAYSAHALDEDAMDEVRAAVDAVLAGHEPYPAVVIDRHWDLVSANDAAFALFGDVDAALLEPPINVVRLSTHPDGLAPRIANFAEYAAHMLMRLRRQRERTADPVVDALLTEVVGHLGDAAASVTGPVDPVPGVVLPLRLRHRDRQLSLFSTVAVFGAPNDATVDDLAIEAFYPADDATRNHFHG